MAQQSHFRYVAQDKFGDIEFPLTTHLSHSDRGQRETAWATRNDRNGSIRRPDGLTNHRASPFTRSAAGGSCAAPWAPHHPGPAFALQEIASEQRAHVGRVLR